MSDESLGSILSNDEAPEEVVDETSAPEVEASDAGETPAAKLDETESEKDEIDAEEPDDLGDLRYSGLKKAARKERKFRQAAEKQAKELQRQLDHLAGQMQAQRQQQATPQQAPQQQAEAKKEDAGYFEVGPEEWTRREAARLAEEHAQKVAQQLAPEIDRLQRQRLDDAEEAFCERTPDGREHIDHFAQLANQTVIGPDGRAYYTDYARQLRAELNAVVKGHHPHYKSPAKFAYETAKAARQAIEMTSPDYEQKLRAKWEAESGIASNEQSSAPVSQARPQHKTIAGARGSSASVRRSGEDPDSMSSILS